MPQHVGGPVRFLADTAFESMRELYAETLQSIAGRTRLAYELAVGLPAFPREGAISQPNPQGRTGVDLSGPPYGSAVWHPVAWGGGMDNAASLAGEQPICDTIKATDRTLGPWLFWNRPHSELPTPYVAPYSRLFLLLRARLASGAVSSTLTVKMRVHSVSTGQVMTETSQAFTVSASTYATFQSTTGYFSGCPSGPCAVTVTLKRNGSVNLILGSWSICNMRKRSH